MYEDVKKNVAVCESLTAIFYIVVHLLYIASEDPCNHNEAMYFMPISGEKEVTMRKVLIPKKTM